MMFKPHGYQQYCINKIIEIKKLGLFLDMGLGKTVTTLTAIRELKYNRFQVKKVLVIAPKKVAEGTWTREKEKWDHTKILRVSAVLGSQARRIRGLNTPADIYIINRENVCWLVDYYRNSWPFDMVVIDESSSFKSHKAKRFKSLASVGTHIDRIVELTGTPSPNGLEDLWAQVYLLDGGERLENEGAEAVVPDLLDFLLYCFYNQNFKVSNLGTVSTESQGAWEYMSAVVIGVFSDQIDTSGRKIEGYAVGISE